DRGKKLYAIQDATIACAYAQLAITALGLGSVWVGAFDEKKVKQILNLPKELKPIAILPIGYPNEQPKITSRRKLEDIIKKI
ncbi:MAG: nitroreductase family protein, partial [Planctomycetota bacterium]